MKQNFWEKTFGASRRRKDKALLASLERDIADGERIARKLAAQKMGLVKDPEGKRLPDDLWRQALPDYHGPRDRIARAFGRPID